MTKVYDFDVAMTCRHDECSDEYKQSLVDEVLRLSKYHTHIIDGYITLDRQNTSYRAEISLRIPGHTLISSNDDYKMDKAFVGAFDKMKAQLQKIKSKIVDHRPQNGDDFAAMVVEQSEETVE